MAIRNKTCIDLLRFKKSNPLVFWLVALYLIFLLIYSAIYLSFYADHNKAMALNELGDFLAGTFSPLAFLFLYLGYRQNSESIKIQSKELRASTEALKLQVEEMKDSVEQQKLLGEFQRIELEERHISVTPILTLSGKIDRINTYSNSGYSSQLSLTFTIKNLSDYDARDLKFSSEHEGERPVKILNKNSSKTFSLDLTEEEIKKYQSNISFERLIAVEFENVFGRRYSSHFILQFSFINEQLKSCTIHLDTIMLIKSMHQN